MHAEALLAVLVFEVDVREHVARAYGAPADGKLERLRGGFVHELHATAAGG